MFSRLGAARLNSRVETWAALGLAVVLGFFLVSGVIAYANIQSLRENNQRVVQTHDVLVAICPSSKHLAQVWRGVNGERASSGVGF